MKKIFFNSQALIIALCFFFTILSMAPSIYEYLNRNKIPTERYFVLEHNYNFDYNFYLSRIREGMEGRWLVSEKYYNQPHSGSLFQIVYVYLGKIGGLFNLSAPAIYHLSRFLFGWLLLLTIVAFGAKFFSGKSLILFLLLAATAGSWPILVRSGLPGGGAGNFYRFATYMGWWSVIDSLQRITIMPHILIGQTFLVLFISRLTGVANLSFKKIVLWGLAGCIAGIVFPPTLFIFYTYLFLLTIFEILDIVSLRAAFAKKLLSFKRLWREKISKQAVFFLLSFPSLIYMQLSFREQPWKALSLFDIEHRFIMPYKDYILALGPVFVLGIAGLVWATLKQNKKFFPAIVWILAIALLFLVFENVPQQSPLRFSEALVTVPLSVLATYFIVKIRRFRLISGIIAGTTVVLGLMVMLSMVLWLTDQADAKRLGSWRVPLGAQLAYPLKDFMEAIFYLRDNSKKEDVVLGYITAGNYIPAYAGNYVYIGHANTPDEDEKEIIAASFFRGEMSPNEAGTWLRQERISYVYSGPQERELGNISDIKGKYDFLMPVYSNSQVVIYKII